MIGEYPVKLFNKPAGVIKIEKRGLYYHYRCTCNLEEEGIYRVIAITDNQRINLGVCVPKGKCWETSGSFPTNRVGTAKVEFVIEGVKENQRFCVLDPQIPFEQIELLDCCVLSCSNQQIGVQIVNQQKQEDHINTNPDLI